MCSVNLVWPQSGGNQQLLVSPSCEEMQIRKTHLPVCFGPVLPTRGRKRTSSEAGPAVGTAHLIAGALWQSSLGLGWIRRLGWHLVFPSVTLSREKLNTYITFTGAFCSWHVAADFGWPSSVNESLPHATGLVRWREGLCHPLLPYVSKVWNFLCYSLFPLESPSLGFEKLRAGGSHSMAGLSCRFFSGGGLRLN